jgi:hypothetical protein
VGLIFDCVFLIVEQVVQQFHYSVLFLKKRLFGAFEKRDWGFWFDRRFLKKMVEAV